MRTSKSLVLASSIELTGEAALRPSSDSVRSLRCRLLDLGDPGIGICSFVLPTLPRRTFRMLLTGIVATSPLFDCCDRVYCSRSNPTSLLLLEEFFDCGEYWDVFELACTWPVALPEADGNRVETVADPAVPGRERESTNTSCSFMVEVGDWMVCDPINPRL